MFSHAQIPFIYKSGDGAVQRIYFSARDEDGKTYPFYLDYDFDSRRVVYVEKTPLLEHGALGTFDDSGIMPSSIVEVGESLYMYYIAWNPQVTVSYRLSIGLAISVDRGRTFKKYSEGPLLDRGLDEIYFNTAPCVIRDEEIFKMWYVSCTGWTIVEGKPEPLYLIRYAESIDGIHWSKTTAPVIDYKFEGEAIGRPWVVKENGLYHMWYSTRGSINYRSKDGEHYTIGYAISQDGINWTRDDEKEGISTSEEGWDSEMIEYCSITRLSDDKFVMLYNGNSFGASGFGIAVRSNCA